MWPNAPRSVLCAPTAERLATINRQAVDDFGHGLSIKVDFSLLHEHYVNRSNCNCRPAILRRTKHNRCIEKDKPKESVNGDICFSIRWSLTEVCDSNSSGISKPNEREKIIHPQTFTATNPGDALGFYRCVLNRICVAPIVCKRERASNMNKIKRAANRPENAFTF